MSKSFRARWGEPRPAFDAPVTPPWYANHSELTEFGSVLIEASFLDTVEDLQYFYEKPWKYDNEHETWEGCGKPSDRTDEGWEWFLRKLEQNGVEV
jgi:hypothetical protein